MIATTANFDAAALVVPSLPVYRFSIAGYSKVFVWRKTGRAGEQAWIAKIADWGVSVDPQNGSYTIDDLVVDVVDMAAAVTTDLGLLLLEGRRCTLQMGFDGLALVDYCTLFSGIVNTVTSNGDSTYSFTCNDYNRLNQRVIYTQGNTGTVTTTVTTYNPTHPYTIITRTDTTDPITGIISTVAAATYADIGPTGPTGTVTTIVGGVKTTVVTTSRVVTGPLTVYETVTTIVGFNTTTVITETYGAFALYTNVITTTVTNQALKTQTNTVSVTYTALGVVGTIVQSDNAAISSSNPRILSGHPLDIMLEILRIEIGYADSDINLTLIEAYRDSVFSGVEFYFVVTGSVDAKDFIEAQLLKPLGGYLFPNYLGQLCVGFAQPLAGALAPVGAITPANLTKLPAINASPLINVVTMRFDKNDDGVSVNTTISNTGYMAESNTFFTPTIDDITDMTLQVAEEAATGASAVQGQLIIESDGIRSGFQGFLLAQMVANAIFAKYAEYNPSLDAPCTWSLFRTELSEFVTLTHPLLPNRNAGVMGITGQLYQVTKRSYTFADMTVTLSLEDASGVQQFGGLRIAPTGKGVFTAVSGADKARYIFQANSSGKQSTGVAAGKLG